MISEGLLLQLLGWAATLGASFGFMRARLSDLREDVKELSKRCSALEQQCGTCLARLREELKDK